MAHPNLPDDERAPDERTPDPAGVSAGPQSGAAGTGGEPKGARLQAQDRPTHAAHADPRHPPRHSSDKSQPGYRARPAGQSGLGEQDDRAPTIDEPQGEGHYIATDRGDKPLRSG